jgi:hypothetical protein
MTTFVFWNLAKKPLQKMVANLALRHKADVLMLAECTIPPTTLLKELNRGRTAYYHYAPSRGCRIIHIYVRFSPAFMSTVREGPRFTIRHVQMPGAKKILLAVNHCPSKVRWDGDSQAAESAVLAAEIEQGEAKVGHQQTVLVGDLNMNPFESPGPSSSCLYSSKCLVEVFSEVRIQHTAYKEKETRSLAHRGHAALRRRPHLLAAWI